MRNGKEMLRVSRVYFYQHDDSDLYEVNERKCENGKRKTSLDDSIVYHPETIVFATVLLKSNQKTRLKSCLNSC